MQQHTLSFYNPLYHSGRNITVRRGEGWLQKAHVGDRLAIKQKGESKTLSTATLVAKAYLPFMMIPEEWIAYEHDPSCQTYPSLLEELKKIYKDFGEEELVTVIMFEV